MSNPLITPLTYAEIDLDAIAHNVEAIKRHIGPDVTLFAVVKANAYGHGALPVARTALEAGAGYLAVARIAEGVALRQAGIDAPILILGYSAPHELADAVAFGLTPAIADPGSAEILSAQAAAQGQTVRVHVKVDTGMGRFGLLPQEVVGFFGQLARLPSLTVEGMFSHFSVADAADKTYTRQQYATFRQIVDDLRAAGHIIPPLLHVANSAATMDLRAMHLNGVRLGIAMYGLRPAADIAPPLPLQPALALKSHLARVRTLPAGASISYGRTYVTPRAMPVGLVPVGYGDGYHRLLSNRGRVLVNGAEAPIVGRVCMDQFVVDLSDCPNAALGDDVVLIGRQGERTITADQVAAWAETINYEVTTGLLPRVPRLYRRHGQIISLAGE